MNNYAKSIEMLSKAKEKTPLGSQTYSKSYRYFTEGSSPAFVDRGIGSRLWDIDGNEFIDFICALGAVTIGYSDNRINEAVSKQLSKGVSFSQPTILSIELAEKLQCIISCAEMVRFVKNGSDATASAVRLARAYTSREIIAVCGYHGMQDWYISSTENNKGIPQEIRKYTQNFKYNKLETLESLFREFDGNIAGIILEPIQQNGPDIEFLKGVRKLADDNGSVLIFDEVVSGFRYALGGAAELYDVKPDIMAIGKGMANGFPLSAVVGKKELLKQIEDDRVFISTTFGDDAVSIVAAIESINIMESDKVIEKFWELGKIMKDRSEYLINKHNLSNIMSIWGLAPHHGLSFEDNGTIDYLDFSSVFVQTMLDEGIMASGVNNLCGAHTLNDIERYCYAFEIATQNIANCIKVGNIDGFLRGKKIDPIFKRNPKK